MQKIKTYIVNHKKTSVVILIIILILGYWIYKKNTNTGGVTRYVTSVVAKGNIIASITGTGQVSASNQIDIKPKVSGDIIYIGVQNGQAVKAGTLIAEIDMTDAQKAVRDAQASLDSAKLSLQKIQIQNSTENMNADLVKAYDDGFTAVSNAFLDLPSTMTSLETLFGKSELSDNSARLSGNTASDYRNQAENLYYKAYDALQKNQISFRKVDRNSGATETENIINETYNTTKSTSDAIKSLRNFVDYLSQDSSNSSSYTSFQDTLSGLTTKIDSDVASLYSAKTNIKNYKDTSSTSGIDVQSSELSVRQKENALQDAKDNLVDYYVRAPFDGTIASIPVEKADSVSTSTVIATLITKKQVAEIPFNEVDVAKIKVGQKATLTFDAISDLSISGEVSEIDSVGTVSSGVVNYNVKISFDTQDDRVKPGMSVSVAIITDMAQDVLIVPSSAVKTKNGVSYIEIFDKTLVTPATGIQGSPSSVLPTELTVVTGIYDDTSTEIVSGAKEGDIIVTKTILGTSSSTTTAPSILSSMTKSTKTSSTRAGGPPGM